MTNPDDEQRDDTLPDNLDPEPLEQERREFLRSLGKWSQAVIGGVLVGGALTTSEPAEAWYNRGGWGNRGGSWYNRRPPGGWYNRRPPGGWYNRRPPGGWYNRRPPGGWYNRRPGGWYNRGGSWYNRGGSWYNREGWQGR